MEQTKSKLSSEEKYKFSFNNNAFDLLRLFAAFQVVYGHAVAHLQLKIYQPFDTLMRVFPGVVILFSISGFLIAASYDRALQNKQSNLVFLKKRLFRIYPALYVAFAVSIVCILTLYSFTASLKEILIWFLTQLSVFQFYTPEFLRGYGVGTPNGSLWTITVEIQFYIFVACFYKKLKNCKLSVWLFLICVATLTSATIQWMEPFLPILVFKLLTQTLFPYLYINLVGMYIYRFRDEVIPVLQKCTLPLIGVFFIWQMISKTMKLPMIGVYVHVITGILLALLTIAFAYKLGKIRFKMDLSYGIYLYHMVVVNVLVQLKFMGSYFYLWIVIAISLLFAALSWRFIEHPRKGIRQGTTFL